MHKALDVPCWRDQHFAPLLILLQAGDNSTWRSSKLEDYRRMGHWRLLFQFEFAGAVKSGIMQTCAFASADQSAGSLTSMFVA